MVGGAGFIGSNLADALVERGYDVHVIDNLVGGKRENVNPAATLHELDIRNYEDIAPVIAGADYVFHLAALPRVQFSIDHPVESNDTNVNGTLNVFLAAKEGGVKRVVYSASSSAYGNHPTMPLHEELPSAPVSPYGLQKYVGEQYARVFYEVYRLPTVALRYFNVYGGTRMGLEGAYALVIGAFIKAKKEGRPLSITGDGEQTRDFTHVRDVVRANILAAESPDVGRGEVMNIGAGNRITINRLAELMGGPVEYIPSRKETLHSEASNKKAKALLGWEPTVSVAEGVAEVLTEWGFECVCKDRVCACAFKGK